MGWVPLDYKLRILFFFAFLFKSWQRLTLGWIRTLKYGTRAKLSGLLIADKQKAFQRLAAHPVSRYSGSSLLIIISSESIVQPCRNTLDEYFGYSNEISGVKNLPLLMSIWVQQSHPQTSTMQRFTKILWLAVCTLLPRGSLFVTGNDLHSLHATVKRDAQPGVIRNLLVSRQRSCPVNNYVCRGTSIGCCKDGWACCAGSSILSNFWFPWPLTFCICHGACCNPQCI